MGSNKPSTAAAPKNLADGILNAPTLSESSKTQYLEKLASVTRLTGKSLEWVMDHPAEVHEVLSKKYTSPLTQRSVITAIKAVFHYNPDMRNTKSEAYQKYTEYQAFTSQAITERYMAAEPSDKERKNWVSWSDVLEREQDIAASEYASKDHLLLAMYCLIEPLRQDFGALRIVVDRLPPEDATGNFLAIARDGSWGKLILNEYKTFQKYGTYKRDLPVELLRIIKTSLLAKPRAYLFVDDQGKPYKLANSFTQYSNRALKRMFGKNFTVSMMRHSHISNIDFNASTPGQLFQTSKNMAHSIGMQQLYRRRVDADPDASPDAPDSPRPYASTQQPAAAITHGPNGERFINLSV